MDVRLSVLSKVGGRDRNEDACGYSTEGDTICCVLCDGAGGHGGGDVAARTAVDSVLESFASRPTATPDTIHTLIAEANEAVNRTQLSSRDLSDMRATIVVVALDANPGIAVWGHVGDSRLYGFRGGYIQCRTRDHSLVQSMLDAGYIDEATACHGPSRNVLTGSLGVRDGFEPEIVAQPLSLEPGDAFLLCSDGFWEYVDEREMESALQRASSPDDWLARMEHSVLNRGRKGQDNYSAMALWYGEVNLATQVVMR
ncbi:MAG: serine/threonine-protein phosphatase [Burkholderiales bacterium]|nr:MAG: serine/threonine-protein phosphatase [Burkholderiales bacterium]